MAILPMSARVEEMGQLIIQKEDRLRRVRAEIRGFEQELELLASLLENSETVNQLPENLVDEIKDVIYKAGDIIDNYVATSQSATAGIFKTPIYLFKRRRFAKKLKEITEKVKDAKVRLLDYAGRLDQEERLQERGDDQSQVPRHLWRFIYYFLLFPANFEVPTRRLIVLWVAEGLIRPNYIKLGESAEQTAERFLTELINRGVVLVKRKKLNGNARACLLKDGIRDAWLAEAKKANFFQNKSRQICRVIDHTGTGDASFIRIHGNRRISHSVPNYGDVISFLSFDTQEGSKPGEDIGAFISKCILAGRFWWLRVLDLERVFRPKLPKTLGKLIRLKYLGLRWTYLENLPNFVNKLLELQVLDVKRTYVSVLPRSIWRMQDLRHLYLSEAFRTRFPDRPSGADSLTHLQTLWGAFIDEDTCVAKGLDTLRGIQKLGLSCGPRSSSRDSDMSKQLEAVDKWISNLIHLECLRLKSRDKQRRAAELHLSTLEKNKKLSTVYLLGKLDFTVVEKFPVSLTDITLSGSELSMDPMGFLGRLPNLQILRLLAKSVLKPQMHCSGGGFLELKVVYIWNLENLEEWQVEGGSLPSLEEFEIRSCKKLKKLPDQLQCVNTLKKFRLTNMPDGFMDETKVGQPQLWAKIELQQL